MEKNQKIKTGNKSNTNQVGKNQYNADNIFIAESDKLEGYEKLKEFTLFIAVLVLVVIGFFTNPEESEHIKKINNMKSYYAMESSGIYYRDNLLFSNLYIGNDELDYITFGLFGKVIKLERINNIESQFN